jgi:hypothetical protein
MPLERSWRVRWLMDGVRLLMGVGVGDGLAALDGASCASAGLLVAARPARAEATSVLLVQWLDSALARMLQTRALASPAPAVARDASGAACELAASRTAAHSCTWTRRPKQSDLAEWLQLIDAYTRQWRRLRSAEDAINLLERLVSGARYAHRLGESGVRLLPMEHADLTEARVAFVLQALEGTLPRRCPDDPFLREVERNALNEALRAEGVYLPTRADAQAAEPMLFQRILHTARERLYFSYPRTQGGDSDALPSFYLEALKARFGNAIDTRFYRLEDLTPTPEDALHPYDQSLCEPTPYAEPAPILRDPAHQAPALLTFLVPSASPSWDAGALSV